MKVPTPQDMFKAASAQTEAILALPNLLIVMNNQLALFTEALESFNRLMAHVDEVVTDIEPGLKNFAAMLENPVIETVPDTIRQINNDIIPAILRMRDTASRFTSIAEQGARLTGRRPQSKAASAAGSESESS